MDLLGQIVVITVMMLVCFALVKVSVLYSKVCDVHTYNDNNFFISIKARSKGTIILSRNNVSSSSYYYGVVRVWDNGWGNICDDYYYNSAEANVICHQLGYTGASSYSRAGLVRCVSSSL